MFNEKHVINNNDNTNLAFIKSANIQVFPCGRRRSFEIDADGKANTEDKYRIPFDPEAKLNTEANNRKHSSLNGFDQTYVKEWNTAEGTLTLSLAGYLFKIKLSDGYKDPAEFGTKLLEFLGQSKGDNMAIYANIRIENIPFFGAGENFPGYNTEILRNQSSTALSSSCLDLLVDIENIDKTANNENNSDYYKYPQNYYFSGLSLSSTPITKNTEIRSIRTEENKNGTVYQREVSLKVLTLSNADDEWKLCQEALLPEISHGDEEGSVKVDKLIANKISLIQDKKKISVPGLRLQNLGDDNYQLQFSSVDIY